jgi:hypothetical protein
MPAKAITTDRQVAALKPQSERYEVKVSGVRGLVARVYPSGARVFELRYVTLDGTRRRMVLGEYPGLGLADAVDQAETIRIDARRGADPAGELRAMPIASRRSARLGSAPIDASVARTLWSAKRPQSAPALRAEKSRRNERCGPARTAV